MTEVAMTLVPQDAPTPVAPVVLAEQMAVAFQQFVDLREMFDRIMADAILEIDGRRFHLKPYWRGMGIAYQLTVEPLEERYEVRGVFADGRENFGYLVTYRASTRNGRSVTGDGACFAIEKASRFKCPHPHPTWKGKSLHFPHASCPSYDSNYRWSELPEQAS